jgi:hypothetical protein
MITTPDLIESLAAGAAPVRRLRPVLRAGVWLLFAMLVTALMMMRETRPDLAQRLADPGFVLCLGASLATGVLAAIAAFLASVPGRSRAWLLLPLPALLAWMSTVGYGCLANWVSLAPGTSPLAAESGCFAMLVLAGLPLSLVLLLMLRHAARLAPAPVGMLAGLAVAGVTASALSLFHAHDASAIALMWSLGLALPLSALGGAFGRRMLAWVAPG